jgi:hypothetical protein
VQEWIPVILRSRLICMSAKPYLHCLDTALIPLFVSTPCSRTLSCDDLHRSLLLSLGTASHYESVQLTEKFEGK